MLVIVVRRCRRMFTMSELRPELYPATVLGSDRVRLMSFGERRA